MRVRVCACACVVIMCVCVCVLCVCVLCTVCVLCVCVVCVYDIVLCTVCVCIIIYICMHIECAFLWLRLTSAKIPFCLIGIFFWMRLDLSSPTGPYVGSGVLFSAAQLFCYLFFLIQFFYLVTAAFSAVFVANSCGNLTHQQKKTQQNTSTTYIKKPNKIHQQHILKKHNKIHQQHKNNKQQQRQSKNITNKNKQQTTKTIRKPKNNNK